MGFARVMNRISALENQGLVKSVPLSEEACAILPAGFEERFPGFRVPLCSSQYMDDVVFRLSEKQEGSLSSWQPLLLLSTVSFTGTSS